MSGIIGSARPGILHLALVLVLPQGANGQTNGIRGQIVDAQTQGPLSGASVLLEPLESGLISRGRARQATATVLTELSDRDGRYAFSQIPTGPYLIRVQRLGYRGATVEVGLGASDSPQLTVGLEVEPIALEPVLVEMPSPSALMDVTPGSPGALDASLKTDAIRSAFLEQDVRFLASDDVGAAMTLGEADLLRALQRVPGVSTRDEYAAELWTRGSPWGQTRIYLDDLPLFDPFFGGGALTAVGPAAVGGVFLHPGARPVSIGEGAAGVVRFATRDASRREGLPFLGEMGMGTLQGTTERRFLDGRAGVVASRRRTWYDYVWNGLVDDGHDPEGPFDYVARSSMLRFDWDVTDRAGLVFSRFRGRDQVEGNAAALITGSVGEWGNAADQLSLVAPVGNRQIRISAGQSRYDAEIESDPTSFVQPVDSRVVVLQPAATEIRYRRVGIEFTPNHTVGARTIRAGIELTQQGLFSAGGAAVESRDARGGISGRAPSLLHGSIWTEMRGTVSPTVELQGGLRLDMGAALANVASFRASPHVAIRFRPVSDLYVTAAGRRSYQYLQQIAAAGTTFGAGHTFGHSWTLAGSEAPALETDIVSVGVEKELGPGWWLSGTGWSRRSRGQVVPDPTPGVFATTPARWSAGRNDAIGIEVQVRRLIGRVTGQASYSVLRSTDRADGYSFPSLADRTHGFDGLATFRLRENLSVGVSFVAYSGAPYTRVISDPCLDELARPLECPGQSAQETRGEPNGRVGPGYASLDLSFDWTRQGPTWGWGLSVQLRNALDLNNSGGYRGTRCPPTTTPMTCIGSLGARDRFQTQIGFPLPLVALRMWL